MAVRCSATPTALRQQVHKLQTESHYYALSFLIYFAANKYRKTIGKDAALKRCFQPVTIDEPTVGSTISILWVYVKSRYEVHHGVEISDAALVTCRPFSLSPPRCYGSDMRFTSQIAIFPIRLSPR